LEEAAASLGISEKHARELIAMGFLPVQHRGDECCIRFADCLDYQQKRAKRRAADRASPLEAARDLVIAKGYADEKRGNGGGRKCAGSECPGRQTGAA